MSERWGDSRANRAALDRHLTDEPNWRRDSEGEHGDEFLQVCKLNTCKHVCHKGDMWGGSAVGWRRPHEPERSGTMGPDNDPVFEPLVITNRAMMTTPDGKVGHGTIVTNVKPDGTVSYAWQPDEEN